MEKVFDEKYRVPLLLLLNIYPFYTLLEPILNIYDPYIYLSVPVIAFLYLYGFMRYSVYTVIISYILSGILLIVYIPNYPVQNIIYYVIWLLLTEYLIETLIKKNTIDREYVKPTAIPYSIFYISLLLVLFIGLSYYLSHIVIDLYENILENTIDIFQSFYNIFVSTRIGIVFFISITVFITYYILKNYIVDLISDLFLVKKEYALMKTKSLLLDMAREIYFGKDFFEKMYRRTILFLAMYLVYGIIYPLTELLTPYISIPILRYVLVFSIWFFLSTIIYVFIRARFTRIHVLDHQWIKGPRVSYKTFYLSIGLLTVYISLLILLSLNSFPEIVSTALGFEEPARSRGEWYPDYISNMYVEISYKIYYGIYSYFEKLSSSVKFLEDIVEKLFEFLWG